MNKVEWVASKAVEKVEKVATTLERVGERPSDEALEELFSASCKGFAGMWDVAESACKNTPDPQEDNQVKGDPSA